MSTSTEPQDKTKKNQQAIASLILGILSLAFALGNFAPGLLSTLGCVGATAALLALLAGVLGLRAARKLDGQRRSLAITGMSLGGLGLIVFIAVMASSVLSKQRQVQTLLTPQPPQIFQSDDLTLTYPSDWQVVDISQQDTCKQSGLKCVIAIASSAGDGTNINLMRFTLSQEATVEEVDQALWAKFTSNTPDVTLVSREAIKVDGHPAIRRIFNTPSQKAASGRDYLIDIYVVNGLALYQFTVWAPSADALTQHQAAIEEVIKNFHFKR